MNPHYQQREKSGETAAINFIPNRSSSRFSTSLTNGPRSLSRAKAGTHSALGEKSHTRAHTPKQGCFGWGWYHYPRTVLRGSETLRGQGVERQTLPLLGLGRGCSQRTQKAFGTAMRLCASLFRGVAAPLGCVICLQLGDVAVFSLCAQYFFPGSLSTIPCAVTFSANMQISLSAISVANTFALWYDKSQIRIFRR